jgi:type IV pilus assembly protein PilE
MTNRKGLGVHHPEAGFTLIELMVTIAIGSMLLAIAVPGYQSQIRKSRRTEARTAVLDLASREERFLSTANNYSQTTADLGYTGAFPVAVGSGYYTLTVTSPDPAFVAAGGTTPSYIITATATGTQLKDDACRTFTVTHLGQQTATTSGGAATTTCWN